MKKQVYILIIIIITLAAVFTACGNNQYKRLELISGDKIPSNIKLFNAAGETSGIDDIKYKYKTVFYLDSKNEDCMKRLDCISRIISLLSFKDMGYAIVWKDRIPSDKVKEAGIDPSYNYSQEEKVSLSESIPTAFLTDENSKIMMVTGYSYISLINKIIDLSGKKDLYEKAAEMILKNVSKSSTSTMESKGKTLLMFLSAGCRKCKENEEIVRKNIDSMQKKIKIISVRPDFDTKQAYDRYYEIDPQQIYFNIFAYAQGVEANNRVYPMFVILNSENKIEKFITDTDEAVNYINGM